MQDRDLLYDLYWTQGLSTYKIADKYGVSFKRVSKWLKRLNIPTRPYSTKGMKFPGRRLTQDHKDKLSKWHTGRKLSPELAKIVSKNLESTWKKNRQPIGTIVNNGNYKRIKTEDGRRWKFLHRHLVEQKIGRELKRNEEVHHINFNKSDNNIDNLLMIDRRAHLRLHSQLEYVMRILMEAGWVYFDGESYRIKHPSV